ncbi:conserved hypothetical protein [Thermoplasma acidophilum]|uniref:DUF72 domain-containing protein n=1 Tax=Thermoplasma acidophilum (strain ATCC 25905 / DSM 1728 / JCM 9062 / NBRC 15155 / AMRC-C165) TaxID=273075 RepID=Q9HJJ4_THEAC|nr:DUF72 domain-containing protein [Thermoplasma acidophilum]CAC12102.1 conserved hypothetical protein [Thermoplasma acidophilum]
MIHLGCSGWSYDEWEKVFYPEHTADRLSFYSMIFNTVEVDSTFYRIPPKNVARQWGKAMSGKHFLFAVKVPGDITHDAIFTDMDRSCSIFRTFEQNVLNELSTSGVLGPILFQMPPRFSVDNVERLISFMECVHVRNAAVEVRNMTLYENRKFREAIEGLGVAMVDVDSTERRLNRIESGLKWAYVRLHGRNPGGWKAENPFDYRYTDAELREIASKIKSVNYDDIFVYFNNHPHGSAPVNAMALSRMVGVSNNAFF